jgi:uncharacterized membrane protein
MSMIYAGLFLWIAIHLFPSVTPAGKQQVIAKIGDKAYQGIISVLILCGLLLIIFGWRNATPEFIYNPPVGIRHVAMLIAVAGIILFISANFPTRIKRFIRHPQLSGVLLWSIAHLLLNGDSRSVTVFGALAAWSLISMFTINRREGNWVKPEPGKGWWLEAVIIIVGLVVSAVIVRFHQYLSGISLIN